MHIISARFSNVRVVHSGQQIFGLVTFETEQGLVHIECDVTPKDHRDIMDPHPLLLAEIIGRSQSKNPQKWSYPPWSAQRHGS